MSSVYKGQCLCGEIKYEVDAFESEIGHCHCSMCRKFHGAAFAALAGVARNDFRWTQGADLLQDYVANNGTTRQFCKNCGSSLSFASASKGAMIEIALGTLDTPLEHPAPDAHIFTDTKVTWYEPQDGLAQYAQGRDSKRLK